ncbi:hypothetical protein [Rhizobium sp. CC-YZS058]|uniref:hypothetical protein n=1 Tax=Rhizobium sp. CC-YZS058 TaxID=3042153 RepID=UPI002B062036|nr:hypothetical protein [Rhizobium sp. CC-YZS058]MEA3536633.1 hypothetical protein [Rhizobium sp. CC-YZS058]
MSSDINPNAPNHIRCEAIASSSIAQSVPCHRTHGSILHYPGSGRADPLLDDPAILIGLALAHVRHRKGLTGTVPDVVTSRLQAQTDRGNPACRLVLSWLDGRRTGASAWILTTKATSDSSESSVSGARKTPRDRIVERLSAPSPQAVRPHGRKRPRRPVAVEAKSDVGPETISANEEMLHG